MKDYLHQCEYCHAKFKTESRFLKHHCKEKQRHEDFKSLDGQAALIFYKSWMKAKHHSIVTNPNAFKDSRYFTAFLKFVKFVKATHIPDTQSYIDLMVRDKIEPIYWTEDIVYGKYLEYVSRKLPTEKLIEITVKTIFDIADAGEVDASEVFDVVTPNDVIQLLHQRRVSPWILLNSKKFAHFFMNNTSGEERVILESIINPEYWTNRFKTHPKDLELAKKCVRALEL